jgi:predicted outer membrane lipoprotein
MFWIALTVLGMATAMVKLGAYSAWLSFLGTALTCAFGLVTVVVMVYIWKKLVRG